MCVGLETPVVCEVDEKMSAKSNPGWDQPSSWDAVDSDVGEKRALASLLTEWQCGIMLRLGLDRGDVRSIIDL